MVVFWALTLFAGTILTLDADRRQHHHEPDGAVSLPLGNVGLIQGSPDLPRFGNLGLIVIMSLR